MEELIKDIVNEISKCQKSLLNLKITDLDKRYLSGMIDAYDRVVFNIEINSKSLEKYSTQRQNTITLIEK